METFPSWGDSSQRGPQPSHPWLQGGAGSGGQGVPTDHRRVRQLEEEVQRLSQSLLDLQAAMTGMNANLRQDLQEDATKIFLSMMGTVRQPASALGAGTESVILPAITPDPLAMSGTEQLQTQVSELSDTLTANTLAIKELQEQVRQAKEDGQLRPPTDSDPAAREPSPISNSANQCCLKDYVDSQISALRAELMEGMEIKMSDLKNSCEYKLMSVSEQCEEQESSYLSLAELLDSKEADLRKEIQELRASLGTSGGSGTASPPRANAVENDALDAQLTELEKAQRKLMAAQEHQNSTLRRLEESGAELEARVGLAERSAEVHYLFLEEKLRRERQEEVLGNSSALLELRRELTDHRHLIRSLEEALNSTANSKQALACCAKVHILTQQVEGLGSTVSALNDSISQHAEELEYLSASCRPAGSTAPTEAPRSREELEQRLTTLEDAWSGVDGRVSGVEGVCGKLEPLSSSLSRIKDGLNKHVTGLWTCVKQMNGTLRSHTRDLHALYKHTHALQNIWEQTTNTPVHSGELFLPMSPVL